MEVALAVGIIGSAFVALLALIPAGLGNFRTAMDCQTAAEIFQRVVAEAQQADFDKLVPADASQFGGAGNQFFCPPDRYFDEQGAEVVATKPGAEARIIYAVHVRVSKPGEADPAQHSNRRTTSLPAATAERFNPRHLAFLSVQIAKVRGSRKLRTLVDAETLLIDPAAAAKAGVATKTHSAVIARNGYR